MQKSNSKLSDRWSVFITLIFDPWVLILIASIVIIVLAYPATTDSTLKTFLTVVISILSSLVGSILTKRWTELDEEKLIVARGIGAIRNLKLLLLNISTIENRVKTYLSRLKKDEYNHELIKHCFEEVVEKCNILQEEGLSSIESWTDIIPEANIKTQIGIISNMKTRENELVHQIEDLSKDIENNKKENKQENEQIKKKLSEKEKELEKVKSDLKEKEYELNKSVLGGLSGTSGYNIYSTFGSGSLKIGGGAGVVFGERCIECGKSYSDEPGIIRGDMLCDECRDKKKKKKS